jgi:site-specific recombinase XerD
LVVNDSGLEDTLAQYQKYLDESGFSPVTIKNYFGDIRHFASWLAGMRGRSLLDSTGDDVLAYCLKFGIPKGHSAATINRRLQSIRKFYRFALRSGLIGEDPSAQVALLPQPKDREVRGLSESETGRLLDAVRKGPPRLVKRDYAIIELMLQTGIRVGELAELRLSDISLSEEKAVLRVRRQGNSMEREIPLDSPARKAMSAYLEERPAGAGDHLFLSKKGGALSVRSVQRLVNTYAQAAGLDRVSTYTLRQTCGERVLRYTGDLSLVARLMGHKRLETAIKYILPGEEDLTEVAEKSSLNVY